MRLKLADALSGLGQLGDPRRQPPVGLLEQRPQPLFEPALVDGAVQTGELLDPGALALPTSGDGDTQSGLPFWRVGEVLRKRSDWVLLGARPVRRSASFTLTPLPTLGTAPAATGTAQRFPRSATALRAA